MVDRDSRLLTDQLVIRPFAFYRKCFLQFPFRMGFIIAMEMFQATMLVLLPYAVKGIVSAADHHDPQSGDLWNSLHDPFMFLVYITLAMVISSRLSGLVLVYTGAVFRRMPRLWLFRHLLGHSMGYFSDRHAGALGAKIHDVTHGTAMATWTLLFDFIALFILFFVSAVTLSLVYWPLGVSVFIWGAVYAVLIGLLTIPRIYWIEKASRARAGLTGYIIDSVANIFSVKSYARQGREEAILRDAMKGEERAAFRFGLWGEAIHWTHFILTFILIVGGVSYAVASYERGHIDLATISYLFTLILILSTNARNLTWSLQSFMEYVGQIRDGIKTIMPPHNVIDPDDAGTLAVKQGTIAFNIVISIKNRTI